MKNSLNDLNLKNLVMYTPSKISFIANQKGVIQKLQFEVNLISQAEFENYHWSKQTLLVQEKPLVILYNYSPLSLQLMASE